MLRTAFTPLPTAALACVPDMPQMVFVTTDIPPPIRETMARNTDQAQLATTNPLVQAAALRERNKWRAIAQAVEEDHHAEVVGGVMVCCCRVKGCQVGPTIARVLDEQREGAG